jgi:hypothetical protein
LGKLKGENDLTKPIITLLSDFGLKDPYVAEMKAVILSICPEVDIVDISHEIDKFNIRIGAFVLASAAPYFPHGTVHIAVVDPRVGTKQRPILVETQHAFCVGPDNGLLMLAAQKDGIRHVYHLVNEEYMLQNVSRTFHGRDIFAPIAANLAKGVMPSNFGSKIYDYVIPEFANLNFRKKAISGELLHIDNFGNIITNISKADLEKIGVIEGVELRIKLKCKTIRVKLCLAYGETQAKTLLAVIGSHNFFEIAINQGNASKKFKAKVGDSISVSPINY